VEKKTGIGAKTLLKNGLINYNSVVIALLILVLGSFFVNKFSNNLSSILVETSIYGFIAVGLAFVMICREIDLSVGYIAASCAVTTVMVINATGNIFLAAVFALIVGAVIGAINGFVVVKLGVNSLIATIATNYIFTGFVYFFTNKGSIYPEHPKGTDLRQALKDAFANLQIFGVKALTLTVIIMIVFLVVMAFIMRRTKFGISMYISGDNAEAGRLSGINVNRVKFSAFVICGICCAIAGIFLASYSGAAIFTQGEGRNIFAISACVIGGVKMAGGKGTMLNVLLGILIMRMISTGMNLMLIPSAWVDFVSGVLLLAVLVVDRVTSFKKE